jgi:hypothetical protein
LAFGRRRRRRGGRAEALSPSDRRPYRPLAWAALGLLRADSGVKEKRSTPTVAYIATKDVGRVERPAFFLSWWLVACATTSLLASGCERERSRSAAVRSVHVEPARGARVAEVRPARAAVEERTVPDRQPPSAQRPRTETIMTLSAEIAPGMNEEFDEDHLLVVDEALEAIDENAFATLFKKETVLVDNELVRKEKFAHPDNCRRWRSLKNRGYAPKSALAKQIDAGALVRCGSLEFLARARPSRVSHVRGLLSHAGPSTLPAIVATAMSPMAEQARDRAVARGATLAEFLPTARTIPSELPGRLSIAEPTSKSNVIVNAEVWGDINSDGIEDLVLSVLNAADDNTSFDMRLIHVTRRSSSSPLTVLAVIE